MYHFLSLLAAYGIRPGLSPAQKKAALLLLCWWSWHSFLHAQPAPPGRVSHEVGLRAGHLMAQSYSAIEPQVTEYYQKAYAMEVYALHSGHRHHFFRISTGYAVEDQSMSTQPTLGTALPFSGYTTHSRKLHITSSLGYGWELAPFEGEVARCFQFRTGITLAHRYQASDDFQHVHTTVDTMETIRQRTVRLQGGQMLSLRAMGQVVFHAGKHLSASMEWQAGPSMFWGAVKAVTTRSVVVNGQPISVDTRNFTGGFGANVSFQDMLAPLFLALGWSF